MLARRLEGAPVAKCEPEDLISPITAGPERVVSRTGGSVRSDMNGSWKQGHSDDGGQWTREPILGGTGVEWDWENRRLDWLNERTNERTKVTSGELKDAGPGQENVDISARLTVDAVAGRGRGLGDVVERSTHFPI